VETKPAHLRLTRQERHPRHAYFKESYIQHCYPSSSFVTAVANECGTVVSPMTGKRLESPPREQQARTSHHRAD
jgi:hypothetical protein